MLVKLKRYLRNFLVGLICVTGIPKIRLLLLKKKGPVVRVVAYHDVPNKSVFEKHIQHMKKKFHIVSPQEFKEKLFVSDRMNILLTFDDGFATWYENVAPTLLKEHVGGILFVSSGFVDVSGDKEEVSNFCRDSLCISSKKSISWSQLRSMLEENKLLVCGGHTKNHVNLAESSDFVQKEEILTDKKNIEDKLGVSLFAFAYPFGAAEYISSKAKEVIGSAGYTHAFTTNIDFMRDGVSSLNIPRSCLDFDMPIWLLHLWVLGGYDLIYKIKNKII